MGGRSQPFERGNPTPGGESTGRTFREESPKTFRAQPDSAHEPVRLEYKFGAAGQERHPVSKLFLKNGQSGGRTSACCAAAVTTRDTRRPEYVATDGYAGRLTAGLGAWMSYGDRQRQQNEARVHGLMAGEAGGR